MSELQITSGLHRARAKAPAVDPEEREKQLIALAVDDVERKIRSGRAPTAVLVHYLKLATARENLEKEKLRREIQLLESKKQLADSAIRMEELSRDAIAAISTYGASINHEEGSEQEE